MRKKPLISPSLIRTNSAIVVNDSERSILDIIRRENGTSRSAITAQTSLSQQSVHRLVDGLVARSFLNLGDPVISGRGQPSPQITLNPSAVFSIGISINTDTVRLSIADLACTEVFHQKVAVDPSDPGQTLDILNQTIGKVLHSQNIRRDRVLGVGVAISGFRQNSGQDIFVTPDPLENWSNIPLVDLFETAFKLPVWVENNGTAGAIGESLTGVGLNHACFAYLSFNHGFGCGIIYDGKPFFGGFNNAGELSRLFTKDQMPHRPALGELIKRLNAQGVAISSVNQLNQEFDPAWPGVSAWVTEVHPQLQLIIRALRATIDPTAIVFGGEAPQHLKTMLIEACDEVDLDRYGRQVASPRYFASALAGDPSTIGAALLPLKNCVLL